MEYVVSACVLIISQMRLYINVNELGPQLEEFTTRVDNLLTADKPIIQHTHLTDKTRIPNRHLAGYAREFEPSFRLSVSQPIILPEYKLLGFFLV